MLLLKPKRDRILKELNNRFTNLVNAINGREATQADSQHGLRKGHWTKETLEQTVIVDDFALKTSTTDLASFIAEIKKL